MSRNSFTFEDLIAPHPPDEFLRDTWEKRPLLVARGAARHFEGLLSLSDVDKVIAFSRPKFTDPSEFRTTAPRQPTFVRGLLDDQPVPPEVNPGIAEIRQVFDQGRSVVIMAMQQRWQPVAELCRNLETVFHCPVHANMYLTPPGSQGFAPHFDTHEVFVVQLDGAKHWRLYDAAEPLPLVSEHTGPPTMPLGTRREARLVAGDSLYIPRGHVHEAFTSDCASLHLTVGVNVYRWVDLLRHALSSAGRRDQRFRESIPGGALPSGQTELRRHFRQLLESLIDDMSTDTLFDRALHSLGDQFFERLQMLPGGQFAIATAADRLDSETVLEKRPFQAVCRVVDLENGGVAIEFPGNRVEGPPRIGAALRFIAGATRFAVRELPGELNEEARLVLARRLVREGLLAAVEGAQPETSNVFSRGAFLENDHANDSTTRQLAETVGIARS
ncbi:MAG TPA: cupin domain-containing protein [Pirellulales bacterium]|nr:cupin domain-containing protein [Pirellulales bacterium]